MKLSKSLYVRVFQTIIILLFIQILQAAQVDTSRDKSQVDLNTLPYLLEDQEKSIDRGFFRRNFCFEYYSETYPVTHIKVKIKNKRGNSISRDLYSQEDTGEVYIENITPNSFFYVSNRGVKKDCPFDLFRSLETLPKYIDKAEACYLLFTDNPLKGKHEVTIRSHTINSSCTVEFYTHLYPFSNPFKRAINPSCKFDYRFIEQAPRDLSAFKKGIPNFTRRNASNKKAYVILSIDGGGIRGIIPAIILTEIEKRTKMPCSDLFDLMAGTSTGGILAAGLSITSDDSHLRPKFKASDIHKLYKQHKENIFLPSTYQELASSGTCHGRIMADEEEKKFNEEAEQRSRDRLDHYAKNRLEKQNFLYRSTIGSFMEEYFTKLIDGIVEEYIAKPLDRGVYKGGKFIKNVAYGKLNNTPLTSREPKYRSERMERILYKCFKGKKFKDTRNDLIIPSVKWKQGKRRQQEKNKLASSDIFTLNTFFNHGIEEKFVFNTEDHCETDIVLAALATSAAPTFLPPFCEMCFLEKRSDYEHDIFSPYKFHYTSHLYKEKAQFSNNCDHKELFLDGSLLATCPAEIAYRYAVERKNIKKENIYLLSLGTGLYQRPDKDNQDESAVPDPEVSNKSSVARQTGNESRKQTANLSFIKKENNEVEAILENKILQDQYWRIDPVMDLDISLDNTSDRSISRMEAYAYAFIQENSQAIEAICNKLVALSKDDINHDSIDSIEKKENSQAAIEVPTEENDQPIEDLGAKLVTLFLSSLTMSINKSTK